MRFFWLGRKTPVRQASVLGPVYSCLSGYCTAPNKSSRRSWCHRLREAPWALWERLLPPDFGFLWPRIPKQASSMWTAPRLPWVGGASEERMPSDRVYSLSHAGGSNTVLAACACIMPTQHPCRCRAGFCSPTPRGRTRSLPAREETLLIQYVIKHLEQRKMVKCKSGVTDETCHSHQERS